MPFLVRYFCYQDIFLLFFMLLFIYAFRLKKGLYAVIVWCILSFVFAEIIYPKYVDGFFAYRSNEVISKISIIYLKENFLSNIMECCHILIRDFRPITLLILVGLICFGLRAKICNSIYARFITIVSLLAIVWCFIVVYIAPFKTPRYIVASFPIVCLCILLSRYMKNVVLCIILLLVSASLITLSFRKSLVEELLDQNRATKLGKFLDLLKDKEATIYISKNDGITWRIIPYVDSMHTFNILLKCKDLQALIDSKQLRNIIIDKDNTCMTKQELQSYFNQKPLLMYNYNMYAKGVEFDYEMINSPF